MRLGTCIALELACAAVAVSGVWLGVGHAVGLADEYIGAREASAATVAPPRAPLARLPGARLDIAPPAPPGTVFEASDDVLLGPLAAAPIVRVKPNRGGTSLSLRLDFANGSRASFKPEQILMQGHMSDPRREVAAYRIDRLLGIGHVPPCKPVRFTLAEVLAAADPQLKSATTSRIAEAAIARNGELHGMVSWWIPEIRDARIGPFRVDEPDGIDLWTSYLRVGATIPASARNLVEQLAALVVFDIVIDNADRWSGSNTKCSPDRKTLYFMDNTLSFSRFTKGHDNNLRPLYKMQVLPRGLVGRLRALTRESLEAALDLGDDPAGIGPLLSDEELEAVMARRDHVIAYVDKLIAAFGEDAVLALP